MISKDSRIRIKSGIILFFCILFTLFINSTIFFCIIVVITIRMLFEWLSVTKSDILFSSIGILSISLSIYCVIEFYMISNVLLFIYIVAVSSVDIFAMIGGRAIAGPKLAPKISPHKTVSGLVIGSIFSAIIVTTLLHFIPFNNIYLLSNINIFLAMLLFGIIEQLSDLFASYVKRRFCIKDYGSIIPGHGGLLDRFDGILLTSPIAYYYIVQHI